MSQPVVCPHGYPREAAPDAPVEALLTRCPVCAACAPSLSASVPAEDLRDELPPLPLGPARASPRGDERPSLQPAQEPASEPLAATARQPDVPDHEILGELGRGGMGIVYKARQLSLNRLVAVKVVRAGANADPEELVRFLAEAEAIGRLHHPNIVQIYDLGGHSGQPYFTMEFIEGPSLARRLAGTPLPAGQASQLGETLARAVHYAHQQGIVHRDLKPANILLQAPAPGLPPGALGVPKIADFGLAKQLGVEGLTQTGTLAGSPSYMAPEQALGRPKEIGPQTDVYALGAILYELLTGRPPFRAATVLETLELVRSQEPAPPRRLQPRLPRDLETICLKCLQKEPRRRYASAGALADDLGRFLEGRPILARPVGPLGRGWRWCRRNPAVAGLLAAVAAALLLGTALASYFALQATQRAADAEINARRAIQEKQTADRLLYAAHMNLAQRAWEDGQLGRLLELLDGQRPEQTGGEDLRGFEWYYLWRLCHGGHRFTLRGHPGPVSSLAYAPDGTQLATAAGDAVVRLWDPRTGQQRGSLQGPDGPVRRLAFSPDGQTLAAASDDHPIRLWDLGTGQVRIDLPGSVGQIHALAFSPDGKTVSAAGTAPGNSWIGLWDVATGQERAALRGPNTNALAYSPDGKLLASGGDDRLVKLWDVENGQEIARLEGHGTYVVSVAFSPDGATLASGGDDGVVKLWDVARRKERTTLAGHTGAVNALAFSPDGQALVSGGWDGTVAVRRLDTDQVRRLGHAGPVQCVAFAPDGRTLASGGADGTAKVWDAAVEPEQPLPQAIGLYSVAFSPDGRTLAGGGTDPVPGLANLTLQILGSQELAPAGAPAGPPVQRVAALAAMQAGAFTRPVRLWDVGTGKERLPPLGGHTKPVRSVAFAPGGNLLATGSEDTTIKLWDPATGRERLTLRGHDAPVFSVAFSPDGKTLASAGYTDRTVRLWDMETGRERAVLTGHPNRVWCVAFAPDGKTVASGDADGNLKLWDVATSAVRDLGSPQPEDWLWCVAFSPDGATVAAGFTRGTVALWDVATEEGRGTLAGHSAAIRALAFSPDGRLLATAGDDSTIKLWDLATRQERATLRGHTKWVWCVAFSPDGKVLASGGDDRTVRLWRAATAEEVAEQSGR